MPTVQDILNELSQLGSEPIKKILMKHGAREPFFGVKVEQLKKIQKRIKKDYALAKGLYDSGVSDAMYLAGLIADDAKMTKADLRHWANNAYWYMLSEYTVPCVAAESPHGHELAKEWIESPKENIAAAGWRTLASLVSIKPDDELPLKELEKLLARVFREIHKAPNRVRYTMNGFVIAVGCYVASLTGKALEVGGKIGKVDVDMGGTACRVPGAVEYIEKVKKMNRVGKKRKTAKC
jgi:3-methyladenine DNA glycosylase AlkD